MAIKDAKKSAANTQTKDFEKAKAFLNISLPSRDGSKTRLVSIPLVESNAYHKGLLDYLAGAKTPEESEAQLTNIKNRIILDVGYSRNAEDAAFDL